MGWTFSAPWQHDYAWCMKHEFGYLTSCRSGMSGHSWLPHYGPSFKLLQRHRSPCVWLSWHSYLVRVFSTAQQNGPWNEMEWKYCLMTTHLPNSEAKIHLLNPVDLLKYIEITIYIMIWTWTAMNVALPCPGRWETSPMAERITGQWILLISCMMYADRIDTAPRHGLTFPPHPQQSRCSIPPRCFYHFLLFLLIVCIDCIDFQVSREQMVDGDDQPKAWCDWGRSWIPSRIWT